MKHIKTIILFIIQSILFIAVVFLAGVFLPLEYVEVINTESPIVISDISVVDVESGALVPNSTVVIEGDRITGIMSLEHSSPPENALLINGSGKFLIPALWDMHVHTDKLSPQLHFPLFIAYGITNIRDMGSAIDNSGGVRSSAEDKRMWNTQIGKGEIIGPRFMGISSFSVNGPADRYDNYPSYFNTRTPEEARRLVRYFKEQNLDFIKVYNDMLPEPFFALLDEAQKAGLDVVGHRPVRVGAIEASNAGMKSFEHARLFLKEGYAGVEEFRNREDINSAYTTEVRREMIEMNDDTITDEIFRTFVENGTWFCPTHGTRKMDAFADNEDYQNDPRLKYIHPFFVKQWHDSRRPEPKWQKNVHGFLLSRCGTHGKSSYSGREPNRGNRCERHIHFSRIRFARRAHAFRTGRTDAGRSTPNRHPKPFPILRNVAGFWDGSRG
jgi:hypothetical protein